MIDRDTLGRRLRDMRQKRGMTLKEVEAASGLSATHVSEIERGRTSPTIGALVRIAKALGCDPDYFLDERELEIASIIRKGEPSGAAGRQDRGGVESLTHGIVGGCLESFRVTLPPGGVIRFKAHFGEECGYVQDGRLEITVGDERCVLEAGDAFHYVSKEDHAVRSVGTQDARFVVITNKSSLV
jgi:transcriptional regulator with XRE-family HTH domain